MKMFKQLDKLTKTLLIVFLILAIITSVVAYRFVSQFTAGMTILDLPGAPILDALTGNKDNEGVNGLSNDTPVSTPEPWDGNSRVTLLILGLDYNDWRGGETPHSDTMILLSLDPITKTASMLSLPRDLWVNIPDFGYGRINEAYFNGTAYNLPGGGAELARQTVEQFIGVPVQYYAVIYFDAFVSFIDEIGGVVVMPNEAVKVEKFGGGQEETLEAGVMYTLDGGLALSYARARYTKDGDVDRARRQQEVILAIKNRILEYESLPSLIAKAPTLYQELSSGISTNLNLQEALQLGILGINLDTNNIKKGVIDFNMVIPTKSPDGESVLKPITDKIRALRDELFATSGTGAPIAVASDNSTLIRDEAAKVVIWDGSGQAGLADRTSAYLQGQGINVIQVADAGGYSPATKIEIFNGKPYSAAFLAQTFGVASANIWNTFDPSAGVDIRVTIGGDWAANNQIP